MCARITHQNTCLWLRLGSAIFLVPFLKTSLPSFPPDQNKARPKTTKMSNEIAASAVAAMGVPSKTPEGSREGSSAREQERAQYVAYPRRWAVLLTVALLNISNAAVKAFALSRSFFVMLLCFISLP